jgi:hypothetical protein
MNTATALAARDEVKHAVKAYLAQQEALKLALVRVGR